MRFESRIDSEEPCLLRLLTKMVRHKHVVVDLPPGPGARVPQSFDEALAIGLVLEGRPRV